MQALDEKMTFPADRIQMALPYSTNQSELFKVFVLIPDIVFNIDRQKHNGQKFLCIHLYMHCYC